MGALYRALLVCFLLLLPSLAKAILGASVGFLLNPSDSGDLTDPSGDPERGHRSERLRLVTCAEHVEFCGLV